jgi:hypothetical protein
MANHPINRLRVGLTIAVSLAIWSLLAWRHLHDGVPAHHLLHNPDAAASFRLDWRRPGSRPDLVPAGVEPASHGGRGFPCSSARRRRPVGWPGLRSAMSVSFSSGHESITSYLFFALLPLALFLPVYRPECLLGFVLGMSVVFGSVLPTLFGSLMALATFVIHRFIGLPLQAAGRSAGQTGTCEVPNEAHASRDPGSLRKPRRGAAIDVKSKSPSPRRTRCSCGCERLRSIPTSGMPSPATPASCV